MRHLKEEFDKLTFKETLMYGITIVSLIAGFVLLFMGLLIPPEGEIHESVLTAFGIVMIFVGLVFGLDMKYSNMTAAFQKTVLDMLSKHHVGKNDVAFNLEKDSGVAETHL